jgi:hypothetical protein
MLEKWLVSMIISFVLRQLAKFKEHTDWAKVRADLETRVKDLVPGTWFDSDAAALADVVLEKLQTVLGATDVLQQVLEKVAAEDWAGALTLLKDLVLKALPAGSKEAAAVAAA